MTVVADLKALLDPVFGESKVVRDDTRIEARLALPYCSIFDGVARERALVGDGAATIGFHDQLQVDLWLPIDGGTANDTLDAQTFQALDGVRMATSGLRCVVIGRIVVAEEDLLHVAYTVRVARLR